MSDIEKFKNYYLNFKNQLEKQIDNLNKEIVKEDNPFLKENLEYLANLNTDGKLIRGTLINLGYSMLKDNVDYSNNLSLAYELFETAILIHDDIIDESEYRRGKETIQITNAKKYNSKSLGDGIAICIGDYGLYYANKIIVDSYLNDAKMPIVLQAYNDVVLKTIKGETIDVILPTLSKNELIDFNQVEENIMCIYEYKTAYYTIIGPLQLGILLAGGTEEQKNSIFEIGKNIGIAFQIQDDILDIYSDKTGKTRGLDIQEYKQTLLYSYTINTEYKEELLKYYGCEHINDQILEEVQKIFKESGAYEYATNMMNEYYNEAIKLIENNNWIKEDKKELLYGFVDYLKNRNK